MKGYKAPSLAKLTYVKGSAPEEGRVVVLDVWATWCQPCIRSIPHLIDVQNKFKDVRIVGVTDEPKEKVTAMAGMLGAVNYAIAVEGAGVTRNLMSDHGVQGIPHVFVFSKKGELAWHGHPMDEGFLPSVETELAKSAFVGQAHSLGEPAQKNAGPDASLPAKTVSVDEGQKKVKICVRSAGGAHNFVLNEHHTIGDLKRMIIDQKVVTANKAFDLVQSFPTKVAANTDTLAQYNGSALTLK